MCVNQRGIFDISPILFMVGFQCYKPDSILFDLPVALNLNMYIVYIPLRKYYRLNVIRPQQTFLFSFIIRFTVYVC